MIRLFSGERSTHMRTAFRLVTNIVLAALVAACSQSQAPESAPPPEPLVGLVEGLASGAVDVIAATQRQNADHSVATATG